MLKQLYVHMYNQVGERGGGGRERERGGRENKNSIQAHSVSSDGNVLSSPVEHIAPPVAELFTRCQTHLMIKRHINFLSSVTHFQLHATPHPSSIFLDLHFYWIGNPVLFSTEPLACIEDKSKIILEVVIKWIENCL